MSARFVRVEVNGTTAELDAWQLPDGGNVVTDSELNVLTRARSTRAQSSWIASRLEAWKASRGGEEE